MHKNHGNSSLLIFWGGGRLAQNVPECPGLHSKSFVVLGEAGKDFFIRPRGLSLSHAERDPPSGWRGASLASQRDTSTQRGGE